MALKLKSKLRANPIDIDTDDTLLKTVVLSLQKPSASGDKTSRNDVASSSTKRRKWQQKDGRNFFGGQDDAHRFNEW